MKHQNSNWPTLDSSFRNWLASQTDDDLRQALREDVGEMIRDRLRTEIEWHNNAITPVI